MQVINKNNKHLHIRFQDNFHNNINTNKFRIKLNINKTRSKISSHCKLIKNNNKNRCKNKREL